MSNSVSVSLPFLRSSGLRCHFPPPRAGPSALPWTGDGQAPPKALSSHWHPHPVRPSHPTLGTRRGPVCPGLPGLCLPAHFNPGLSAPWGKHTRGSRHVLGSSFRAHQGSSTVAGTLVSQGTQGSTLTCRGRQCRDLTAPAFQAKGSSAQTEGCSPRKGCVMLVAK